MGVRRAETLSISESGVHQIVDAAFDSYEREIAQPRHADLSEKLTQVLSTMDKIDGGVTAIKHILRYLGGAVVALAALYQLIQAVKGPGR